MANTSANKATWLIRMLGITKIPLLAFVWPKVKVLDKKEAHIVISFKRRTKNHLGSMYFGALWIGAEATAGISAWQAIQDSKAKVDLIFKEAKAQFLKRAQSDVTFICTQGDLAAELVKKTIETGLRVESPMEVIAYCNGEKVAQFEILLSLKYRTPRN